MLDSSVHTTKNLSYMLNEKHASKFFIFGCNIIDMFVITQIIKFVHCPFFYKNEMASVHD